VMETGRHDARRTPRDRDVGGHTFCTVAILTVAIYIKVLVFGAAVHSTWWFALRDRQRCTLSYKSRRRTNRQLL